MYLIKKMIAFFTMPLTFAIVAQSLALFLFIRDQKKLGIGVSSLGIAVLGIASTPFFGEMLMRSLEREHPVITAADFLKEQRELPFVVVLSGGFHASTTFSDSTRLAPDSLRRLLEGISLHRQMPNSELLLSGGIFSGPEKPAQVMADLAVSLGCDPSRLTLETEGKNTAEQAEEIKKLVGEKPFVLVTSASHLPRAMALFEGKGMSPVAFPCDHIVKTPSRGVTSILPSIYGLALTNAAIHEYLGMIYAWLAGKT